MSCDRMKMHVRGKPCGPRAKELGKKDQKSDTPLLAGDIAERMEEQICKVYGKQLVGRGKAGRGNGKLTKN